MCVKCVQVFSQLDQLTDHMRIHTENPTDQQHQILKIEPTVADFTIETCQNINSETRSASSGSFADPEHQGIKVEATGADEDIEVCSKIPSLYQSYSLNVQQHVIKVEPTDKKIYI